MASSQPEAPPGVVAVTVAPVAPAVTSTTNATTKKSEGFGGETKEAKMARYLAYTAMQDHEKGLSMPEVAARRAEFGFNALDGACRNEEATRKRH